MALVVLDASVIIGFLDPEDALHESCVAALTEHQHDDMAVPASAYAEILVGPYRAGAEAVAEVEAFLADFAVEVGPITATIARRAALLRSERKRLRIPDALVLAAGDELGADIVLTGDESWAKMSPRVAIVRAP